jgi:hypothetical protein
MSKAEDMDVSDRCIEWRGAWYQGKAVVWEDGPGGRRRSRSAYRYIWEQSHGPIPEGFAVMRGCETEGCANPEHLICGPWKLEGKIGALISYALAARRGEEPLGLVGEDDLRSVRDKRSR